MFAEFRQQLSRRPTSEGGELGAGARYATRGDAGEQGAEQHEAPPWSTLWSRLPPMTLR